VTKKGISNRQELPAETDRRLFRLPKAEMLKKERDFALLFAKGKRFRQGLLQVVWFPVSKPEDFPVHILVAFSAPKRLFKRSPDRNLLKRRMREGYRLNRPGLLSSLLEKNLLLSLIFLYNDKEIGLSPEIHQDIMKSLQRIRTAL